MNGWLLRAVRIGQFCLRVIVPLAVLLALGVVLIFFLFPAADLWFVWKVYRRFVDTVANTTGFNSYLVMAGAPPCLVPFFPGRVPGALLPIQSAQAMAWDRDSSRPRGRLQPHALRGDEGCLVRVPEWDGQ